MGQRLIISIEKGENHIAKIYYHWSAYTISALYETQKVADCIYNHEDESIKELQLRLIRMIEANGGGIRGDEYEFEYIQKMYPNETFKIDGYNRSNGLIALSEKGMKELQDWSEGDVIIDLDEDLINFGVYSSYESFDEYIEERKEWDEDFEDIKLETIPDIGFDIGYIEVSELNNVIEALDAVYGFNPVRNGNEIIELVD